jgi:hypothetical protein
MIDYFAAKGVRDFKNSKKFWQLYKSWIKLKSDVTSSDMPSTMSNGDQTASALDGIAKLFNSYFTSISSISLTADDDCHKFIFDHFKQLKQNNVVSPGSFAFTAVTPETVAKFISNLDDSSSAGNAGIKILKLAPDILTPLYTSIFNSFIENSVVPSEWKSATVSPLFKNQGSNSELNNYRGISVLPLLSKVFEKILNEQIVTKDALARQLYMSSYQILMLPVTRLISMLLFIDYRKAFDTVDSNLIFCDLISCAKVY